MSSTVLRITLASCEDHETPVGYVYIMEDAPLYAVCEMLARETLTVVSVNIITDPDDTILADALTGTLRLRDIESN